MKKIIKIIFLFLSNFLSLHLKNSIHVFNGNAVTRYFVNTNHHDFSNNEKFIMDDGSNLILDKKYRWSIKPGWMFFPELLAFHKLSERKKLLAKDIRYLKDCIGENTINFHPREISAYFESRKHHYSDHLLSVSENDPILVKPSENENHYRINSFFKRYKELFAELSKKDIYSISSGDSLLEIGYESGGHSLFALEKLGFNILGIDNGYSGLRNISILPQEIKEYLGSNAEFIQGDITKQTPISPNTMSVINTVAVLEHIMDLPSAFKEMYRILKPGGIMIHSYDPYFHPAGGHGLGVLDSPWAHLQLNTNEYERYLREHRPNEFREAFDWFHNAIHRSYPERLMMQLISLSGFEILYWNTKMIKKAQRDLLSDKALINIFNNYPEASLTDLFASEQTFVARKI
ncbi:class I SAM-dependent methyltransferase [Gammaproteobacteria bacterium]|nr:class I SAM-dependent methyltransferase [Gammaproteobacteria bacterium]MDC0891126.1 class I SAM-dependent methyltransferase [Gammaproteobacteria bacterium]